MYDMNITLFGFLLLVLGILLIIFAYSKSKGDKKLLSDLEEIVNDASKRKEILYAYETLMNEWDNLEGYELKLLRMKGVLLDKLLKFV